MSYTYGTHKAIQTVEQNKIQIIKAARFANLNNCCFACDSCDGSKDRKYYYVLENGYEYNYPAACSLLCCVIPPNCCCPGRDCISKTYFDRGIYDRQTFCFQIGALNGQPTIYEGPSKAVCCCMECCDCWNYCVSGYFVCCCGEKLSMLPYERFCWCCPARACWLHNYCSLCGPKNGEPIPCVSFTIASHLESKDEGAAVAQTMNGAREAWKSRCGIQE